MSRCTLGRLWTDSSTDWRRWQVQPVVNVWVVWLPPGAHDRLDKVKERCPDKRIFSIVCVQNHKWLCSPPGSAFLCARREVQELIEPLVVSCGWNGSQAPADAMAAAQAGIEACAAGMAGAR